MSASTSSPASRPAVSLWRVFPLIFIALSFEFLASRMRPIVRWQLRRVVARYESSDDAAQRQKAAWNRVFLGFLTHAPWSEVEPWLREAKEKTQWEFSSGFVQLYLHNNRSEEAKAAARFGIALTQDWIDNNRKSAMETLKSMRRSLSWHGRCETAPHDVLHGEKMIRALEKTFVVDRVWLIRARDAKLALQFIEWAEQQDVWHLGSKNAEKNPFFPSVAPWNYELAQRMEMPDKVFDDFWSEAINLSKKTRDADGEKS